MKGIDLFCASQASTAILIGTDEISPSSSSPTSSSAATAAITLLGGGEDGGGRAIDRHNPIIRDGARRIIGKSLTPCISQQSPINPRPYNQLIQKGRNKSSKLSKEKVIVDKMKKKVVEDELGTPRVKTGKFISPPTSSRYLLDDSGSLLDDSGILMDFNSVLPPEKKVVKSDELSAPKPPSSSSSTSSSSTSSSSSPTRAPDQVVVLRVSLHCRGCVGKLKKHISRMQGVTSFNIDFAAKKVTVVGDVTPMGLVENIAKVMKNAQLWTPTMTTAGSILLDVDK